MRAVSIHIFAYGSCHNSTSFSYTKHHVRERQNEHVKGIKQSKNDLLHIWLWLLIWMWCKTMGPSERLRNSSMSFCSLCACLHVSKRVCVCVSSSCFELEWTWHSDLSWSKYTLHNSCSEITHQNHHHRPQLLSNQPALSVHPVGRAKVENTHTHTHFPFSRYIRYKSQFAYLCRPLMCTSLHKHTSFSWQEKVWTGWKVYAQNPV